MAINRVIDCKDALIELCIATMKELCDVHEIDDAAKRLHAEQTIMARPMTDCINTNARVALHQDEYKRRIQEYEAQYSAIQEKIAALEQQRTAQIAKMNGIREYVDAIRFQGHIVVFREALWNNAVDRLRINSDGTMKFEFKGGPSIEG